VSLQYAKFHVYRNGDGYFLSSVITSFTIVLFPDYQALWIIVITQKGQQWITNGSIANRTNQLNERLGTGYRSM
jgi:hypothetical protein